MQTKASDITMFGYCSLYCYCYKCLSTHQSKSQYALRQSLNVFNAIIIALAAEQSISEEEIVIDILLFAKRLLMRFNKLTDLSSHPYPHLLHPG